MCPLLLQACLVAVVVPDPDFLCGWVKKSLGLEGSYLELSGREVRTTDHHTHARMESYTVLAHTHIDTHTRTHTFKRTHAHLRRHTCTLTQTHNGTHTHTHTHTLTDTHAPSHTHPHTH